MDPSQRLAAAPTDRGEASGDEAAPSEAGALPEFLDRFAPPSRQLHWLVAIPVLLLLITGFTNFWPEAKGLHLGGARLFAWLQNFRRLVTRYEYHAENFLGFVQLGSICILLRRL